MTVTHTDWGVADVADARLAVKTDELGSYFDMLGLRTLEDRATALDISTRTLSRVLAGTQPASATFVAAVLDYFAPRARGARKFEHLFRVTLPGDTDYPSDPA